MGVACRDTHSAALTPHFPVSGTISLCEGSGQRGETVVRYSDPLERTATTQNSRHETREWCRRPSKWQGGTLTSKKKKKKDTRTHGSGFAVKERARDYSVGHGQRHRRRSAEGVFVHHTSSSPWHRTGNMAKTRVEGNEKARRRSPASNSTTLADALSTERAPGSWIAGTTVPSVENPSGPLNLYTATTARPLAHTSAREGRKTTSGSPSKTESYKKTKSRMHRGTRTHPK